ncbi:hypothetical protein VNO77_43171 [Canavalia gladiata]|uniref:Uncharacterized protein n=1 Tax=Canavalia gladiata TaxID=3824 RepID=A0AAN9PP76_CANGL
MHKTDAENLSSTAFGLFKPTHHSLSLSLDFINILKNFQNQLCEEVLKGRFDRPFLYAEGLPFAVFFTLPCSYFVEDILES